MATKKVWLFVSALCVVLGYTPTESSPLPLHGGKNVEQEMNVGGLRRTYLLHVPPAGDPSRLLPLIIVLHGGGGVGKGMVDLTRGEFDSLADAEGALLAYPDGIDRGWNDGRTERRERGKGRSVDDVAFIASLIDHLEGEYPVDHACIDVAGISNGAFMAYRLACALSDKIAAIAPVDGNIAAEVQPDCSPGRSVSVLAINNVADPLVPWNGGEVTGPFGRKKLGRSLSVAQSVAFWVKRDSCSSTPVTTQEPDRDPRDGTRARKEDYAGGTEGSEVVLYAVEGGGHTWPGGRQYLPSWIIGKTCRDFDATSVIWEFFKRHHRQP